MKIDVSNCSAANLKAPAISPEFVLVDVFYNLKRKRYQAEEDRRSIVMGTAVFSLCENSADIVSIKSCTRLQDRFEIMKDNLILFLSKARYDASISVAFSGLRKTSQFIHEAMRHAQDIGISPYGQSNSKGVVMDVMIGSIEQDLSFKVSGNSSYRRISVVPSQVAKSGKGDTLRHEYAHIIQYENYSGFRPIRSYGNDAISTAFVEAGAMAFEESFHPRRTEKEKVTSFIIGLALRAGLDVSMLLGMYYDKNKTPQARQEYSEELLKSVKDNLREAKSSRTKTHGSVYGGGSKVPEVIGKERYSEGAKMVLASLINKNFDIPLTVKSFFL